MARRHSSTELLPHLASNLQSTNILPEKTFNENIQNVQSGAKNKDRYNLEKDTTYVRNLQIYKDKIANEPIGYIEFPDSLNEKVMLKIPRNPINAYMSSYDEKAPKTLEGYDRYMNKLKTWLNKYGLIQWDIYLLNQAHYEMFLHEMFPPHIVKIKGEPTGTETLSDRKTAKVRVSQLYSFLAKYGYTINPVDKIKINDNLSGVVLPTVEYDDVLKLMNKVNDTKKAILILYFASGMRLEELTDIRIEDIDLQHNKVFLRRAKKGQNYATLGIARKFVIRTIEENKKYGITKGHLFYYPVNPDKNVSENNPLKAPYKRAGIVTMLRRLAKDNNMEFSAHSFRRGFAVWLYKHGATEQEIMKAGRWVKADTMYRYLKSVTQEKVFEKWDTNLFPDTINQLDKLFAF